MNRFAKPVVAFGLAGALALAAASPSEARSGRNAALIGAGVAGLALGAAIGTAAASSQYHHGYQPYGYYDGYAYSPGYTTYGYQPAYTYAPAPAYTYGPGYAYDGYAYDSYATVPVTRYNRRDPSSYYGGAYNRERALTGHDW
jgi:hypothetical protein